MALVLRKHQREGLDFILNNGRLGAMLWHEMGLGKTATSLEAARTILGYHRANGAPNPKLLIIMPKSASSTWRKECLDNYPDMWQSIILLPFSRMHEEAMYLSHQDVRVIAIDEWHYLKNPESKRCKNFANLLVKIGQRNGRFAGGKIIPLTGTPMPNSAAEWYSAWATLSGQSLQDCADRILSAKLYADWSAGYSMRVAKKITTRFGEETRHVNEGVEHSSELIKNISPFVHFRKAIECLDMPQKNINIIDLGIPDDKLLEDADITKPEEYMALLERLARAKAPHMMEWVNEFLHTTDKQLVMFSMYLAPIYELQVKHPKDVVIMTGAETTREREANVLAFQQGKVRIIAMSYATGAESLNLQNAHTSLYLGYPWTDGKLKQAEARTWRQGQKQPTFHYYLSSGYNDSRILNLVRSKAEATTEVEKELQEHENRNKLTAPLGLDDLF